MSVHALQELRETLERRFPDALPPGRGAAPAVATGIGALDALLPGRGLIRGRMTVWQPEGGATAVLRAAVAAASRRGERAAWVDGGGSVGADFWRRGPLLVRPPTERAGLVAAEELLRSGAFALVVLAGCGREGGREAVRLSRAARSGGTAFVLVAAESALAHLRVRSRTPAGGYQWRRGPFGEPVEPVSVRVEVEASSLGWSGRTSFELPVRTHEARLGLEPELVDRRGAPARVRWHRRRRELAGANNSRERFPSSAGPAAANNSREQSRIPREPAAANNSREQSRIPREPAAANNSREQSRP